MSIFGNIQNGVFSGFGKPYIKLEFDDNTALLDFQKRMNESGEAQEAEFEDGEFRPIEGTAADEETRKYNFYLLLMSDIETLKSEKFTSQTLNNYERDGKNFKITTPIGEVIIKRKLIYGADKHLLKHIYPYFNVLKRTLEDPTCIFKSSDNKGHLNNTFAKCFYLDGIRLLTIVSPINPNTLELKTTYPADKSKRYINNYNEVWDLVKRGGEKIIYSKKSTNDLCGLEKPQIIKSSFDKIIEFRLPCKIENNFSNNQIFDKKNLGAPGDVYLVTDTRKNPRKELDETAAFKKIDIEKFNVNALKALQDSDPILYEEIKAGIGKTANPYLYNNNEIIDCRGLKPTYKILDNYDNFFDVADSKTNFAGFGLADTKKLISETCRAHWKDCKKIAAHLKGDSLLQSCFNLWHWLRFNIRYEYDKEGREEIRTPLRVWQDRARGVDCDCLSVFSWCVLRCMGYDPVFELVAFKNRPQFSHIFINCDGVVVDRVWFVFNSRPPLVTKRELFRVDLINNLGQLF